ncbi:hypothetical protein OH77DRAFT_533798 [Trametes cingulata]|nr:hypothetical protein OH77DRAFT_533798 [Trametes cingulata]
MARTSVTTATNTDSDTARPPKSSQNAAARPADPPVQAAETGLSMSNTEEGTPPKRKVRELKPIGPRECKWNGCGRMLADGKDIWAHMKAHHDKGRDTVMGAKAEPSDACVKGESPQSMTKAGGRRLRELEEGEIVDEEEDELEPGEIPDDEGEEELVSDVEQEASPSQSPPSSDTQRAGPAWSQRVRCRWTGCTSVIQHAGLRRHIESKHIPLRGAFCPKGCGYWMNRGDMLSRHVEKCQHTAAVVKEEKE